MSLFLKLWRLLDTRQRRRFVLAQLLALVLAALILAGVAAVVPFFAVLADRELISRNRLLSWLYQHVNFASEHGFVVALVVGLLAVVLLGNTINMVGSLVLNRFAQRIGQHFCVVLFDEYLHRGLQFHLASNSATLFNNVIWKVDIWKSSVSAVSASAVVSVSAWETLAHCTGARPFWFLMSRQARLMGSPRAK